MRRESERREREREREERDTLRLSNKSPRIFLQFLDAALAIKGDKRSLSHGILRVGFFWRQSDTCWESRKCDVNVCVNVWVGKIMAKWALKICWEAWSCVRASECYKMWGKELERVREREFQKIERKCEWLKSKWEREPFCVSVWVSERERERVQSCKTQEKTSSGP